MNIHKWVILTFGALFALQSTTAAPHPSSPVGVLSGRVLDSARHPIAAATVLLIRVRDSAVVRTTPAGPDGSFSFSNLEEDIYLLKITAVGYTTYRSGPISINQRSGTLHLPDILLASNNSTLQQAVVTIQKSYIEQKIDRTIVNVGALISNTGANALEVLEKSPGITVDENGTISFKGKTGVLVLIDDKPTYLSAANLATYLRSLPSSALDKIELMDNPPAKYDAAGNAGVINIRTKKSTLKGFNGVVSASYGQAVYGQTNESANLNYRVGKINLFSTASYSFRQSYRRLDIDRAYFDNNGKPASFFNQTSWFNPTNNNSNLKLGMDYYSSAATTWGIVLNGTLSSNKGTSPVYSLLSDGAGRPDSSIDALNTSKGKFNNGAINLNYSHRFDSLGQQLTFDLDYVRYTSRSANNFLNNTFYPDGSKPASQTILDSLPAAIDIYAAKADYSLPLKRNAKFEAGFKSSYVNTDNAANYFNLVTGSFVIDYDNTNRFLYKENINAVYLNYNRSWSRFSLQTGFRTENTNASGHQLGNAARPDSSFIRHYTNLFPTAYFSYKLDSAGFHSLVLSYGRRIGRPYYQDLNPFVELLDKFTQFAGNPFLKPQFTDNYKLSYSYRSIFTAAFTISNTTDLQTETIQQNGDIFISRTGNIGQRLNYGISITAALQPARPWTCNIYSEVFNNSFRGPLYSTYLNQSGTYWLLNATNQFTLPRGWSAELSGLYITRRVNGQFVPRATGQINAGLQKKILRDKGSLRLSARDILHSFRSAGTINGIPNATASYYNYLDSQVATLGFTYSFGRPARTSSRRNTGSSDTEQSRIRN